MTTDRYTLQYDRRTVWLHWATAVGVIFQWAAARLGHSLPKGPVRLDVWSVHVLVGFLLAVAIAYRVGWRLTRGRRLPTPKRGPRFLASLTHMLLYVLLVGTVGLGVLNTFAHGFPLFGTWRFPQIGPDHYAKVVNPWHELFANLVMALGVLHALVALFHRYVLRDGVFQRMWTLRNRD